MQCPPSNTLVAVHPVLQTVELLEAILSKLWHRDLLLAQRVSKHFREVIRNSTKLQRKLFLLATDSGNDGWTINPMLASPNTMLDLPLFLDTQAHQLKLYPGLACQRLYGKSVTFVCDSDGRPTLVIQLTSTGTPKYARTLRALDVTGVWRRMYIARPQCNVEWRITMDHYPDVEEYITTTKCGTLVDALLLGLSEQTLQHDRSYRPALDIF